MIEGLNPAENHWMSFLTSDDSVGGVAAHGVEVDAAERLSVGEEIGDAERWHVEVHHCWDGDEG